MSEKIILLVEDNPDDEALTKRALSKTNIANQLVVARDGVEAWEYLTGTGGQEGRERKETPQLILLDLKLQSWTASAYCAGYGATSARGFFLL